MLTTLKTQSVTTWNWSGAGYVRESPSEKQLAVPNLRQVYKRARYYDPSTGEFISRDPLEYVDGMSQYRGYFVPGSVDFLGLQTQAPTDKQVPDHTNCAGYAIGLGVSLQPTGSIWEMAEGRNDKCGVGVSALDCAGECRKRGFDCHSMGYVYITKGYKDNFDRIKAILDWLRAQNNGKDIGDFEFDDLNAWFCKHYGACDAPVLDFHFLKGNCVGRPDYTYQPCHTKFGTPEDCTRNPKEFTPTKERPDYFGDSQLVSKMCCCKNKRKLVPIRRPKLVPIRRKPPEEIGLDRR